MAKEHKPFLPQTLWGKIGTCALALPVLFLVLVASLVISGRVSQGRFGLAVSRGNSLSGYIPEGSMVMTLPLPPREGSYVTAMTELPDDTRDTTSDDRKRKLSVKWYDGTRLVSTDSPECYSNYEYRGRVVAWFPTQEWFPWMNTGAQKPIHIQDQAERDRANDKGKIAGVWQDVNEKWVKANCRRMTLKPDKDGKFNLGGKRQVFWVQVQGKPSTTVDAGLDSDLLSHMASISPSGEPGSLIPASKIPVPCSVIKARIERGPRNLSLPTGVTVVVWYK